MKKMFLLLAIASLFVSSSKAQLRVDAGGNAHLPIDRWLTIGSESNTTSNRIALNANPNYWGAVLDFYPNLFIRGGQAGGFPAERMVISSDGFVGFNKWPDAIARVDINGVIRAERIIQYSDKRLKENIVDENSSDKLFQLSGKMYNKKRTVIKLSKSDAQKSLRTTDTTMNTNFSKELVFEGNNRLNHGFLAQDLQKIYPELVYQDSLGYLSVDYVGLIPIMLEAMKKQQTTIETLKKEVAQLKKANSSKNKDLEVQSIDSQTATNLESAILYQNAPNPFSKTTEIRFYLPSTVKNAALYIYDMQGIQKKKIEVSQRENGSVTINGSEFVAGMYIYTLIADGKEVDTKRMILTE